MSAAAPSGPALGALRDWAAQCLGTRLQAVTGSGPAMRLEAFEQPLGDPGLFGPNSVAWRVHAHFTAMMVGGLSSLMVQALHPRALAAVWDHSDFQGNLKGRLGRTAWFVASTTYGGRAMAEQAIARVNAIHARVQGADLQGRPYVANAPELVAWVHGAEVSAFWAAYQHLALQPLSPAQGDAYVQEMRQVGHALGAQDLPATLSETQEALRRYGPELRHDARAQHIVRLIEAYPVDPWDRPFMAAVLRAAFDVMPDWALHCMGRTRACAAQRQLTRRALQLAQQPVQWLMVEQGVAARARARVQAQKPL